MPRFVLVTPARPGTRNGNRHTANRWASMLRSAGHRVAIATDWDGARCDLLLALHARRSASAIARFRAAHPDAPLVLALTGTDLYKDLPDSREARESIAHASLLVVLQEDALRFIPRADRRRARVVVQSADPKVRAAPPKDRFRIAVIGHLRSEKDPFRAALALEICPGRTDWEVVQIGDALEPALDHEARERMARDPRYRWLGGMPHPRAMRWLAHSHLLVVSSVMEGGANVIAEAARIGTPVIASRISGNRGMLGRDYPGYYRLGDTAALARQLRRAAEERGFLAALRRHLRARRALFAPRSERRAIQSVVREALAQRSTP